MALEAIMHVFTKRPALIFLLGVVAILFSVPLYAQTAVKLEAMMLNPAVNWQEAAVFVLEASEKGAYNSPEDAFRFALEKQWLPKNAAPTDTTRLNGIALLLMRSFDQKGGIFYSIFRNPHYAYREMVQLQIIRGNTDPFMAVSGQELLLMIGRILTIKEQEAQK